MQRIPDSPNKIAPRVLLTVFAEKVGIVQNLVGIRLLQPVEQGDVGPGEVEHVYRRPHRLALAHLSRVAVFQREPGQRGELDAESSVFVVDSVDEWRDHDDHFRFRTEILARPEDGEVDFTVGSRVRESVDVLG